MTPIVANDLKRCGVSVLANALAEDDEVTITVRGKKQYVVMTTEHYNKLREYELAAAVAEARADYDTGRFKECSVAEHLAEVSSPK